MGCGCNKKKTLTASVLPETTSSEGPSGGTTARVAVYEVVKDGAVVLSTTSPTAARDESNRLSASLRVTSRPVDVSAGEPVPA